MLGTPTVLDRMDVIETEEDSIYVQAFLHPTLNVRVVPTKDALSIVGRRNVCWKR